tara:strand:- start:307 stop:741 length:435 start_codon:yes stop_codon:yes gene_type:complete
MGLLMEIKEIDLIAKQLQEQKKILDETKAKIEKLEGLIIIELESRSSDTNWASVLSGVLFEIRRNAKNSILADDLRAALGEWVDPKTLDKMIRPEQEKTIVEPARVMLSEVNKVKKEGGEVANLIEKVTTKTTSSIKVFSKGNA